MSAPVSQFYILSSRGDSIIAKDFRGDVPKSSGETFFRNVKFWGGKQQEAPPVFYLNGVSYMWIKTNGLYFVFTNKFNCSPAVVTELLRRLTKVFKDYCGVLTEESIRSNFILVYELLDEVMDFGHIQSTETSHLKQYVHNSAVVMKPIKKPSMNSRIKKGLGLGSSSRTKASSEVDKPIADLNRKGKRRKNEIFVDIFEKIDVTFNAAGMPLNASIQGTIQMKSYLAGNPELKFALSEELSIGKGRGGGGYGSVELDDANFHECVNLDEFETGRVLSFLPPDGEFVLMNYRSTGDFRVPFRIFPFFELVTPYKVELIIKIRADVPEHNWGGNINVEIPMPKQTASVVSDLAIGVAGQATEYDQKQKKLVWRVKKFPGGVEHTLRSRITLKTAHTAMVRKEIGPISMNFEIPMYNPSGLQVRYLRILEGSRSYNPYRWVRYVTRSNSYVCRL